MVRRAAIAAVVAGVLGVLAYRALHEPPPGAPEKKDSSISLQAGSVEALTASVQHLEENFAATELELSDEEVATLSS